MPNTQFANRCKELINRMKYQTSIIVFLLFALTNTSFGQKQDLMPVNEIREIIKLAIDYPDLQQYYHVDADPKRTPLIIKKFGLINSDNMKGIEKFGKDIVILTEEEIEKQDIKAYVTIGDWTYGGQNLRLQLEYVIEGVLVGF